MSVDPYAPPSVAPQAKAPPVDLLPILRRQQNLALALIAGTAAALVGAVLWAVVTIGTNFQIGFMAVGVGLLVGLGVRLGKGVDKFYGYLGAVLALAGCVCGNFFTMLGGLHEVERSTGGPQRSFVTMLQTIDYAKVPGAMLEHGSPIDLLFYGIAVVQGYRGSFRRLKRRDIDEALSGAR